ncbi:hypothetical protein OsJ_32007 [Oryza sativa Japonica Group]|uniref:Uncharacterized protein n=1 Tax=Oryza sativa subsp. japonica TaxID=39947 RepID=B9G6F1_ORYSJ|nr:hypothetical protein OsJ_32007 [Oryza sativa Japonica Group]
MATGKEISGSLSSTSFSGPVCRPRRGRGCGASFASRGPRSPPSGFARRGGRRRDDDATARKTTKADSTNSSTLTTRRGPLVMPENYTAPQCILVESPHHCKSHGWMARVRLQPGGLPQEVPYVVTLYCPYHGWTNHARCVISPSPSPEYSPATPLYTPTPTEPPLFLLSGTIVMCRGAPPFYMAVGGSNGSVLSPPSPPPAPSFPSRPTEPWRQTRAPAFAACPGRDGRWRQIDNDGGLSAATV